MAKEATLQVRMDSDIKDQVEKLYQRMGTTFAEAVRIFAAQSLLADGMPLTMKANPQNRPSHGILSKYANQTLLEQEDGALARAMEEKHGKAD